jgi:hypothetical protein
MRLDSTVRIRADLFQLKDRPAKFRSHRTRRRILSSSQPVSESILMMENSRRGDTSACADPSGKCIIIIIITGYSALGHAGGLMKPAN